jgi:ferrochelatase
VNQVAPEIPYDAVLVVSFGGPECRDDVIPFLENVLRGKPVPRERMLEVAEHYYHFDGISPINQQCRDLIAALKQDLHAHGIRLPVYWGNRNWHPYLPDTVREMRQAGVRRALAYVTSGFSCYSGCRQYRENLRQALAQPEADGLHIDKLRVFYNHPDFIEVVADRVRASIQRLHQQVRGDEPVAGAAWQVIFTAHSIPRSMADTSDYVRQLRETCRLVADSLGLSAEQWELVYQSRSGRPEDPWLEPDILDHLEALNSRGVRGVVISPVGFLSDHIEVLYDLDDEARKRCDQLGLAMVRAATPGQDPKFVSMIRKLIQERLTGAVRESIGQFGPNHDVCPESCCPAPAATRRVPAPSPT